MIADLEVGKYFYKKYCSGCHGIFSEPVAGAPDFGKYQIKIKLERSLRRAYAREPVSHAVIRKMSMEELNTVMSFIVVVKKDVN